MRKYFILIFIAFCTIYGLAQEQSEYSALRSIIEKRNTSVLSALLQGDARAYADHFTENAFVMYPGVPIVRGREQIFKERESDFKKIQVVDGKVETLELDFSGNLAYELGEFRYSLKGPEGDVHEVKGKYLAIWKRTAEGTWLIQGDVGLNE